MNVEAFVDALLRLVHMLLFIYQGVFTSDEGSGRVAHHSITPVGVVMGVVMGVAML